MMQMLLISSSSIFGIMEISKCSRMEELGFIQINIFYLDNNVLVLEGGVGLGPLQVWTSTITEHFLHLT